VENAPLPDAILARRHLDTLRQSCSFRRSQRLFSLLAFLVEETLAGRGSSLKELVIGDALYSRTSPYDPRVDSTVRVEARRLRRKLIAHYEGPGHNAPLRIVLPSAGYQPTIEPYRTALARHGEVEPAIDLAVMPFRSLSMGEDDGLADAATDELIALLDEKTPLRLASRLAIFPYQGRLCTVPETARDLGARVLLHGTLRVVGQNMRVAVELADPHGCMIWSRRLLLPVNDRSALDARIANEVMAQLPDWILTGHTNCGRVLAPVS
jgi:TolB-like protein